MFFCDITPRQLLAIAGERLSPSYKQHLASYQYGRGAFKGITLLVIPFRGRRPNVRGPRRSTWAERSTRLLRPRRRFERADTRTDVRDTRATRTLFDGSRAPAGRHTAWAYCHVPNGSKLDMLSRLENQVERFAPGFRERILARRIFAPSDLECMDANLVGGDVQGGAFEVRQFLLRPSWRGYSTSDKNI